MRIKHLNENIGAVKTDMDNYGEQYTVAAS